MSDASRLALAYWVNDLSPFLIRFTESFGIRYYGLGYLVGFAAAAWLLRRYARAGRSHLPADRIGDFMIAVVLGVLLGGRLGYFLLYQLDAVRADPFALLRVWEGGMSSHGGFAGVMIALWWFSRTARISLRHLADLSASTASTGMFFVRIANFINGELWGKVTRVSWAVIFPHSAPPGTPLALIAPRHPSQLYEAALEGALLLAFIQWRFWRSAVVQEKPGHLAGEYLLLYALVRMGCEVFREPDAGVTLLLGLSRGTFYSIFLVLLGGIFLASSSRPRPGS
ncbi:MAG: prolipoprotein diacylglyceryl transferase [Opitutaceae bacterium]|nr:prolipoprotein diacylglyceryl transferase [Opitutaceae bacterium]